MGWRWNCPVWWCCQRPWIPYSVTWNFSSRKCESMTGDQYHTDLGLRNSLWVAVESLILGVLILLEANQEIGEGTVGGYEANWADIIMGLDNKLVVENVKNEGPEDGSNISSVKNWINVYCWHSLREEKCIWLQNLKFYYRILTITYLNITII